MTVERTLAEWLGLRDSPPPSRGEGPRTTAEGNRGVVLRALRSPLSRVLLLALLVREAFSFWTGHPFDFEAWIRTGYVVAHGENPYSAYWPSVPGTSFSYLSSTLAAAGYLPFWPELLGGLYAFWTLVGGGDRFVLYFLLKQPGILADVLSTYLLYRLTVRWTGDPRRGLGVARFWAVFPYGIVITAIWGQFDSIVVALLLALLFVRTPLERNLANGLGIFVKWLAVIFLPLELFRDRGWRRLSFLVMLAVPATLTLLLFAAEGWSLGSFAAQGIGSVTLSQAGGRGAGMTYASILALPSVIAVLGGVPLLYSLLTYAWVPGVVLAGFGAARWVGRSGPESELRALLLVVTVFLLLRWGLYEQYWLYPFALLALEVAVFRPGWRRLFFFTYGITTVYLLVNNNFGLWFLSPVDPGIFPYTIALDANDGFGVVRSSLLLALSVVVTVTLVQWVRALWRNEPAPQPWPRYLWPGATGARGEAPPSDSAGS